MNDFFMFLSAIAVGAALILITPSSNVAITTRNANDDLQEDAGPSFTVLIDTKTGLQYLSIRGTRGLTPRLDANGKHMRTTGKETQP